MVIHYGWTVAARTLLQGSSHEFGSLFLHHHDGHLRRGKANEFHYLWSGTTQVLEL